MEQPKTYNGYDDNGNVVASYTGADASLKINPEEIKEKIEKVVQVSAEQTKKICSALENVKNDADDALVVQGATIDSFIDMAIQSVEYIKENIEKIINAGDLYSAAESVHDQIQIENNKAAYNKTASSSGVKTTQEV